MTVLDICFEKQWNARLVSTYGILKNKRVASPDLNHNRIKSGHHVSFGLPEDNFFITHPLIAATLSKSSQRSYLSAFQDFRRYVKQHPTSPHELDVALHAYITEEYQDDPSPGNRQRMCYLIAFLCISCPQTKKEIGLSRRAILGWNKLKPPLSGLPLTQHLMLAFARFFQQRGSLAAAVALALQWATYMRGSEVLALNFGDVALPGDPRLLHAGHFAGVNIEKSETGPRQFTIVRDKYVISLLDAFLHRNVAGSATSLFNVSYRTFNTLFKDAACFFGLDFTRFTSHSAHVGGAMTDYCNGISAKAIALTGRWKSFSSLERYLQNGRSWLLRTEMTPRSRQRVEQNAKEFSSIMESCLIYSSHTTEAEP